MIRPFLALSALILEFNARSSRVLREVGLAAAVAPLRVGLFTFSADTLRLLCRMRMSGPWTEGGNAKSFSVFPQNMPAIPNC